MSIFIFRISQCLAVLAVLLFALGCKSAGGSHEIATAPADLNGGLQSASGHYVVVYQTNPDPIPLNVPFHVNVMVYDTANRSAPLRDIKLDVDGRMPHHRHGMNRQPIVTQLEDGTFAVQGMLFHMPGRWELYFDITRNGRTERAQDVIFLD